MRGKSKLVDVPYITLEDVLKHLWDKKYYGDIRIYGTNLHNRLLYYGPSTAKTLGRLYTVRFISAYYRDGYVAIYCRSKPKKR